MEYVERVQWVEACQMFFDAYVKFQIDGTEAHWYQCNYRNIEIAFSGDRDSIMVQLYCPEVLKSLSGYFGMSVERNEELISMLHWLIWEAKAPSVYSIDTTDSEQECDLLRDILIAHYQSCYYVCDWKGEGEERLIIRLHGVRMNVSFYPNDMYDLNGYIDVKVQCPETGEQFDTVVPREEDDPLYLIREIQRMAWVN